MKNWILKGIRELIKGSNPHSNGEIFSRFFKDLIEIKKFISKIINLSNKKIKKIYNKFNIIYIN